MIRSVNWLRVSAAVLSSSVFFFASCTAGMFIPGVLKDPDDYGPAQTQSHPVPGLATMVATVPDAGKQGQRKAVFVFFSSLEEFKKENPGYSFLLSPGIGRIENIGAEMTTDYEVAPAASGKIVVKTKFHHDVPPAGIDVKTRYEATDTSINVLNVKYGSGMGDALVAFVVGLILAITLHGVGKNIRRRAEPEEPGPSAIPLSAEKPQTGISGFGRLFVEVIVGLALIVFVLVVFG